MDAHTELLFPPRVIPALRTVRGEAWQFLVDQVLDEGQASVSEAALVLTMARLNGCWSCNADSFRALNGCRQCSIRNLRRARESDAELAVMFADAQREVSAFVESPVRVGPQTFGS